MSVDLFSPPSSIPQAQFLNLLLCRCFQLSYLEKHPEEAQEESGGSAPQHNPSLLNHGFPLSVSALVSFRRAPFQGFFLGSKVRVLSSMSALEAVEEMCAARLHVQIPALQTIFGVLEFLLLLHRKQRKPLTARTAAKTTSSALLLRLWWGRTSSAAKTCSPALTAPSPSRRSNSAAFKSTWVCHKVGRKFRERCQGSEIWLGKANFSAACWVRSPVVHHLDSPGFTWDLINWMEMTFYFLSTGLIFVFLSLTPTQIWRFISSSLGIQT